MIFDYLYLVLIFSFHTNFVVFLYNIVLFEVISRRQKIRFLPGVHSFEVAEVWWSVQLFNMELLIPRNHLHPFKTKAATHLQEYISNVLMLCLFHYDSTELYLWIFNLGRKNMGVLLCFYTPESFSSLFIHSHRYLRVISLLCHLNPLIFVRLSSSKTSGDHPNFSSPAGSHLAFFSL